MKSAGNWLETLSGFWLKINNDLIFNLAGLLAHNFLVALIPLLLGVAALVLLLAFPFNFAHFADALPGQIRFIFGWLNNDIARIFLWLPLLFGPFAAIVITIQFLVVSWKESSRITSSRQQFS